MADSSAPLTPDTEYGDTAFTACAEAGATDTSVWPGTDACSS